MIGKHSYLLSFLCALVFHGIVFVGVAWGWRGETTEIIVPTNDIVYLNAVLVSENPVRARARKEDEARGQTVAAQRDQEKKVRAARERKVMEQSARKRELEERRNAVEARVALEEEAARELEASQEVELAEEEKRRNEWSLSLAVVEEQEYRRAVTDDEKAQAYVAQITRDIIQNWSRPPSARNGMEAVLKVFLAPTGEVVNVSLLESSGNESFDRSAVLAVQKAERFMVPLDARQFERNFREFSVLFRPEDLRQ